MKTAVLFLFKTAKSAKSFKDVALNTTYAGIKMDRDFIRSFLHDPAEHRLEKSNGCYGVMVTFTGRSAVLAAIRLQNLINFARHRDNVVIDHPTVIVQEYGGDYLVQLHDCDVNHDSVGKERKNPIGMSVTDKQRENDDWIVIRRLGFTSWYLAKDGTWYKYEKEQHQQMLDTVAQTSRFLAMKKYRELNSKGNSNFGVMAPFTYSIGKLSNI